jgi:hypothetical protein
LFGKLETNGERLVYITESRQPEPWGLTENKLEAQQFKTAASDQK